MLALVIGQIAQIAGASELEAVARIANSITVFALGGLIIWALVNRKVVTKGTYDEMVARLDDRIEDIEKERDVALAGWTAQTEATKAVATQLEQLRSEQAFRQRLEDEGRRS